MYIPITLSESFIIKKVVSIHYFEYGKNFEFCGEKHDFWEIVYIDKGEADIIAEQKIFRLNHGELIFHKPNEWHNIKATGKVAPNVMVISFICNSSKMKLFSGRILSISHAERAYLSTIIREASIAFSTPLNDPFTEQLTRNKKAPESEQLIKLSIELLMISLYRAFSLNQTKIDYSVIRSRQDKDIVDLAVEFLTLNLNVKVRFYNVCSYVRVSGATLKKAFKSKTDMGVMEYYIMLKIERAKLYIRENNYNFTEISELLSYDSLHHFSKQFKQKTGMSPSEYALSVKSIHQF